MNILYVNACLRKESRTKWLADRVLEKELAQYPGAHIKEMELQRLAMEPLTEERLRQRDALLQEGNTHDPLFALANQFVAADRIVVAAPYYDLQFPALLKIYLENICVCGIAFRYSEEGIPIGLCKADELIYVTTAGGYLGDLDFGFTYLQGLCKMLGISKQRQIAAEGLDIVGNDPQMILRTAVNNI